ncbi:MAG TPA: DNA gyrase/topoisomerase IV subunit A [Bacteroidales bacterium]|nr:DNA gyrase/topoisomerase IV subunit A [Bacteroidales bacterium]
MEENKKDGMDDNDVTSNDESKNHLIVDNGAQHSDLHNVIYVQSMFENWFLDYASYAILDRALPDVGDGLKPVQRRILYSMYELEDGRYNKVANIVGNTMKYHPHGDASIASAIVQLGQKELTIDPQGNWGNIFTGDSAAAARYIEARLTKLALEVVFNPKTTPWQKSYDGRNREPICLPIKFPLLLAQGVEGIAVGLATKILPHNFNELLDASIAILENKPFELFPDFPTGGSIDVGKYNDGAAGSRIRNRAKISIQDNKTLIISEIPYGTNTIDLIKKSITPQIERGKLKIKRIDDNTAKTAEIIIHLYPGTSPDQTIDALYAFTNCEISHYPNQWVIYNGKPAQLTVSEILKINTDRTLQLLQKELQIFLEELENQWHWISLEKIFFEKRIYKELEKDTETWENQIENIKIAFVPYQPLLKKEISHEDILKLCEKPVRKISKFDIKKADDAIADIEIQIDETKNHLDNIVDFTINYFRQLKKKYGKGRERKTEIKSFDTIVATTIAVANQKLYVNKSEGFIGTALKKDDATEFACDCSDIDDVIVFFENGKFLVSKIQNKQFVGKNILHVEVFKRNDDRTVYNMIYANGVAGPAFVKRFSIGGVTRDKEYDLTQGKEGSKVLYLTSNPNGEAEKVKVFLRKKAKIKKLQFEFDFGSLAIKGRSSRGNTLSRHMVSKVELSQKGFSTLDAISVSYDPIVMRLNNEERGNFLGKFKEDDKIISVYKSGNYRITGYELSTHFEDDLSIIQKFNPNRIITAVYYNKKEDKYFLKRFIPTLSDKKIDFIPMDKNVSLLLVSIDYLPQIEVKYYKKDPKVIQIEVINVAEFIEIQNVKAKGKRVVFGNIKTITLLDPLPYEEPEEEIEEAIEDVDNDNDPSEEDIDHTIAKEIFENIGNEEDDDSDSNGINGEQLELF